MSLKHLIANERRLADLYYYLDGSQGTRADYTEAKAATDAEVERLLGLTKTSVYIANHKWHTVIKMFSGTPEECKEHRDKLVEAGIPKDNLGIFTTLTGSRFGAYTILPDKDVVE